MVTAVVGGGEDSGDIGPDVTQDPVVVVREANALLLALMGSHNPQEPVVLKEGDDGGIAEEIGAATGRVGHEVKLLELQGEGEEIHSSWDQLKAYK